MDLEKTKKIIRYKDKLGNEIDKDTWEQLYENDNYKIIKQERIDKFFISTMWLGISHFDFKNQDFFEGFNAYFETMVFEFYSDDICRSCDRASFLSTISCFFLGPLACLDSFL